MPAIEACNPDWRVAIHSTTTTATYGDARQTPSRARPASTTRHTAATANAPRSISSE